MFYLTTHSTHFIYGYMASDIWLRTILIVRKETRCRHIGYSFLTARVLLYAPSHRQDSTYHGLCYTSRGALAGTRNTFLWRKAIIIPIPKPGKDSTNRPIALTSCICKTMERIINRRLVCYLESHNLLTNVQCEFRSRCSTVDHLVRFETFCREAFIHNQHLVSVFFDLEKTYGTT